MRAAVTHRAVRRPSAVLGGAPVYAALVVARLGVVAGCAGRLGRVRGMRILFALLVASLARQRRVSALFQLRALIVAGGAGAPAGCLRCERNSESEHARR